MSRAASFRAAIDRLVSGAKDHRIAIVCSEAAPESCHRRLLVGKVLTEMGIELRHIRADGSVSVEQEVNLDPTEQPTLFAQEEALWRSIQSVSHRRRPSTSSAA